MDKEDFEKTKDIAGCNALVALILGLAITLVLLAWSSSNLNRRIATLEARIEVLEHK